MLSGPYETVFFLILKYKHYWKIRENLYAQNNFNEVKTPVQGSVNDLPCILVLKDHEII